MAEESRTCIHICWLVIAVDSRNAGLSHQHARPAEQGPSRVVAMLDAARAPCIERITLDLARMQSGR